LPFGTSVVYWHPGEDDFTRSALTEQANTLKETTMSEFPRTTVGGVSLPRMIIGDNWFLGYSHTSLAKDKFIKALQNNTLQRTRSKKSLE
jgi:hypothetical protein